MIRCLYLSAERTSQQSACVHICSLYLSLERHPGALTRLQRLKKGYACNSKQEIRYSKLIHTDANIMLNTKLTVRNQVIGVACINTFQPRTKPVLTDPN
jgi:hypothetical protein